MDQPSSLEHADYLSAAGALQALNVRRQTLYAYVSRGWIRSVARPGQRDHLYSRDDVERLRLRSRPGATRGDSAPSVMYWGQPSIPTSITEITPEGPRYRGHSSVQLARSGAAFESVAELLWTGIWRDEPLSWETPPVPDAVRRLGGSMSRSRSTDQLLELFALATLQLGIVHGALAERTIGGQTEAAARQIIQTLAGYFGYLSPAGRYAPLRKGEGVAAALVRVLGLRSSPDNRDALQAALVLFADHELSPAAFAARVIASSGASLHSCIASAICAGSGLRLGRHFDRVESLIGGTEKLATLVKRARDLQTAGNRLSGFGHPLYPRGDPRGMALLDLVQRRSKQTKQLEAIYRFVEHVGERYALYPRHEFGLVVLRIALGMPIHSAGALFALARVAGCVAHTQEQRLSGTLLCCGVGKSRWRHNSGLIS